MLLEIQVAALADLAIHHLPKISEARKKIAASGSGRLGDEYLLQRVPMWVCCNPLSSAIERQAAHLLELTQMHSTRTREVVTAWHPIEGETLIERELPLSRNLPETLEPALLDATRLLCSLSGEPLPPWVQNTALEVSTSQVEAKEKEEITVSSDVIVQQDKGFVKTDPLTPDDTEEKLAELFDPVTVPALEKMFPAGDKWKNWAERASRNKLIDAREGRAMFNPYRAAIWFQRQQIKDWDHARCKRVLANNLPARSSHAAYLLKGELP